MAVRQAGDWYQGQAERVRVILVMRIVVVILVLLYGQVTFGQARVRDNLRNAALVKVFYAKGKGLFWSGGGGRTDSLRLALW